MSLFGLGLSKLELRSAVKRSSFSHFLPWLFSDKQHGDDVFLNQDNTIGYMWEITPVQFLTNKRAKDLEQILNREFPQGTVLQFILHADNNIEPIVQNYLRRKTTNDTLVQRSIKEYADYLRKQSSGMTRMSGIPLRNYRAFVCLKSPNDIDKDLVEACHQSLEAAKLDPRRVTVETLVHWARQIFNGIENNSDDFSIDERKELHSQIIKSNTKVEFSEPNAKIGNQFVRVVTPKELGKTIDPLTANRMFGGFMGVEDDTSQFVCPYIYSINIIFDSVKRDVHTKASIIMGQKFGGTFAAALARRINEFQYTIDQMEERKRFVKIIPSMMIYSDDSQKLSTTISRISSEWKKSTGWEMQEETKLAKIMAISSLPFGLYHVDKNVDMLDREFINTTEAVSKMLPVQGEYQGSTRNPVTILPGRKGQMIGINIDESPTSKNFLVSAESGSGKSFFLNKMLNDEKAANSKVRVLDIGGSYKKMAMANSGRYIDFESERVCINPLDFKVPLDATGKPDKEDFAKARDVAVIVVAEMTYSASGKKMDETEWTILKMAVDWALESKRQEDGVDAIIDFCANIQEFIEDRPDLHEIKKISSRMAFNLYDFSSKGAYGEFFCGPSNFNITTDEFVVIELEKIRARRELFGVVVMQMLNLVTADLYLGDRSQRTYCLFEEVASLLKKQGHKDLSQLGDIIEEGYRRARKYNGSFGVVLQSMLDLEDLGENLGTVIRSNCPYKFLLQGGTYEEAADKKIIRYEGVLLTLLDSVKNNKPFYSEVMIDGPYGKGVGRLYVDPWTAALCTSEPLDQMKFERLIKQGRTPTEAIAEISGIPV